ncbi:MAG: hypothetical protein ACREHV_00840 [Rhizomicrobium sp.]
MRYRLALSALPGGRESLWCRPARQRRRHYELESIFRQYAPENANPCIQICGEADPLVDAVASGSGGGRIVCTHLDSPAGQNL